MLFGTMTASPLFVWSLVARQVIATTRPSNEPIRTHWSGAERLLDLDREAGKRVAQRVLQREADDDRAHRGRRQELLLHHAGARDQENPDDDRVLHDVREVLGRAVHPQGVDGGDHQQGDDAEGEEQVGNREELGVRLGREEAGAQHPAEREIHRERQQGEAQLAADQAVDGDHPHRERHRQPCHADEQFL